MAWDLQARLQILELELKEIEPQVMRLRRGRLLPDVKVLEKVARYESHLHRLFLRGLHELQRLQTMRMGQWVPVVVDVSLANGASVQPALFDVTTRRIASTSGY